VGLKLLSLDRPADGIRTGADLARARHDRVDVGARVADQSAACVPSTESPLKVESSSSVTPYAVLGGIPPYLTAIQLSADCRLQLVG
jgi:hypothetical protein